MRVPSRYSHRVSIVPTRTLTLSIACACACAAACARSRPTPIEPPKPRTAADTTVVAPPSSGAASPLAAILAGLVLTSPGGVAIAIEDVGPAVDACEAAGWPPELPEEIARAIDETPVGSHAMVVHPEGNTTVTIAGIECQARSEGEEPIAYLRLDAPPPEGPPDPREHPTSPGLGQREHLGVLGATVAATTRLVDPVPLAIDRPQEAARREQLGARLSELARSRGEDCQAQWEADEDAHRPVAIGSAAAVKAAIEHAEVYELRSGEATLLFAMILDEQITFGCSGLVETVALLLDPNGEILLELSTNNRIELDWLTDLDGDGIDEAMLDLTWLEDGMHEIRLLHRAGDAWDSKLLWASEVP